jgi:signal transduction histidine kinase
MMNQLRKYLNGRDKSGGDPDTDDIVPEEVSAAQESVRVTFPKVKLQILLPFTTFLCFVVGLFLVTTYLAEKRTSEAELLDHAQTVQRLFQHEVEEDSSMMHGTLDVIVQDNALKAAVIAGDRAAVLERMQPLYESLQEEFRISHFYFVGADRRVIARLHQPDRFGDLINRVTLLRAERTRQIAFGVELGALGTLTLRAVIPWWDEERIVGYVELGHDVEHFLEEITSILNVDLMVLVYKKFVDYDGWKASADTRERPWDWDEFETVVSVAQTIQDIPQTLRPHLDQKHHNYQIMLSLPGDERDAHVAFLPLYDAAAQEIGDIVVIRDITEEQRAFVLSMIFTALLSLVAGGTVFLLFLVTMGKVEQDYRRKHEVEAQFSKLSREHERIVQVEKLSAIGLMIGEIAHQINNPLVGVVNMAQLAQRDLSDPSVVKEQLDAIIRAGKHCHSFVKRMVEFTRISRSDYQEMDVRKLIEETNFLFRQSDKRHETVVFDFPETPVMLPVDPVLIRHALFNLLSNAAQANADVENPSIHVSLCPEMRGRDRAAGWCISVEDVGPGLNDDVQKRMFTPFFTTRAEGTGLGLPVVQYAANLHGGFVRGENRPEGGAKFCMWLPENPPGDVDEA